MFEGGMKKKRDDGKQKSMTYSSESDNILYFQYTYLLVSHSSGGLYTTHEC